MPILRTLPVAPDLAKPAAPSTPGRRPKGVVASPQKYAVEVRPSAIDGLGAFALEAIPAQRKIGEILGESVSTAEAFRRAKAAERETGRIFMVALSHTRSLDATHSSDPMRYANHSCSPNMVLKVQQGRVAFYALRDIAAQEELTTSYGATHHAGRLTCKCGAPNCGGNL